MSDMVPFGRKRIDSRDDFFPSLFRNFFNDDFLSIMTHMNGNFRADLKETDDNYLIEADLPGIKKEAIDINYHNNYLTISATRDESMEDKKENYVRRERRYGEFKRSFYIDNVDEEKINASFNDGVLRITLPKLNKDNRKKRRININ